MTKRLTTAALSAALLCCLLPTRAGASELTEVRLTPEQVAHASQFVDEKLAAWIDHLGLGEWKISASITPRKELKIKTLGGIHWDKKNKTAEIRVMDPADYRLPYPALLDDLEFTIVHELVHLELALLPRTAASRSEEEAAVNRLAEALLKVKRQD